MPKYVYPAIFTPDEDLKDYYVVEFPDLEAAVTQGKNFSDSYRMAEDILNLVLMTMENHGEKFSSPTALENIKVDGDKIVGLVEADTDAYRKIFLRERSCHEIWYSPITNRRFFVLKDDEENVCERVAKIIEKISGVNVNHLFTE